MNPNFLIIGTQRGGTTTLHHLLSAHPQIRMARAKELHFFNRFYSKGYKWYQQHFEDDSRSPKLIRGEATPAYLFHPLVPERVARHLPDVKLIILLRDPVIRAYSQFMMIRKRGYEPVSDFIEALKLESDRLVNCNPVEDEQAASSEFDRFYHFSYQKRGMYGEQIQRWMQYFPFDRFHFIKSEEFFTSPENSMKSLYGFLNISPIIPSSFTALNRYTDSFPNHETLKPLYDNFRSDGILLRQLIGDRFRWE